jgi:hypothetical protein
MDTMVAQAETEALREVRAECDASDRVNIERKYWGDYVNLSPCSD